MPRVPLVPLVDHEAMDPDFRRIHEAARQRLGYPQVNSVRAMANGGELAAAAREFLSAAFTLGSLDRRLRILIRLAVSSANDCRYCTAHQVHLLVDRLGLPEALVTAVTREEDGGLEARERAAVRFARQYARSPGAIPADVTSELGRHFSPQEIVEMAVVAGAMGMLNGFNDGLGVPLEPEAGVP